MKQALLGAVELSKEDLKKFETLPIINHENPNKKFSEKEEKFLREVKTYEFMNLEEQGLMQSFTYGSTKNKMKFTLFHGEKYKVPRFIADHINNRSTPMYKWKPSGYGEVNKEMSGTKSRFQMREVFEGY